MTTKELVCGNGEALVGYLYCAAELSELGGARQSLSAWTPPHASLGFRIAADPPARVAPARVAWWRQPLPAWGQAVAAVALFGLGMAAGTRSAGVGSPSAVEDARGGVSTQALAQLEARMKQEIAAIRTAAAAPVSPSAPGNPGDEAILRQVRQLIRESEGRQQEAFTVRTAQIARDAEIQRRVDQAQMQQALMQMQGTTGEEVRRQREMINYLVNVSQRGR
jgi:hypothetical protein